MSLPFQSFAFMDVVILVVYISHLIGRPFHAKNFIKIPSFLSFLRHLDFLFHKCCGNKLTFDHFTNCSLLIFIIFVGFARRIIDEYGGPSPRRGKKNDEAHPPIHPTKYSDSLQGRNKTFWLITQHKLKSFSLKIILYYNTK